MRPDSYEYLSHYWVERRAQYLGEAEQEAQIKLARTTGDGESQSLRANTGIRQRLGFLLISWGQQLAGRPKLPL